MGRHPDTGEYEAIRGFNGVTGTFRYRRPLGQRVGIEIGSGLTGGKLDNLVRTFPSDPWQVVEHYVAGDVSNGAAGLLIGEAVLDIRLSRRIRVKTRVAYYGYFHVGYGEYGPAFVPVALGAVGF